MPKQGFLWRHVIISTWNSWLPGDPRGFRSKKHKIHSSGDYKFPPPAGEHKGLYEFSQEISGNAVLIPSEQRERVGRAIVDKLKNLGYQLLALSVGATHSHWQAELPEELAAVKHVVGQCKSKSSHAIRELIPGRVWAREGCYKIIADEEHQRQVFRYILEQQDAWVWSYRDDSISGAPRLEQMP